MWMEVTRSEGLPKFPSRVGAPALPRAFAVSRILTLLPMIGTTCAVPTKGGFEPTQPPMFRSVACFLCAVRVGFNMSFSKMTDKINGEEGSCVRKI